MGTQRQPVPRTDHAQSIADCGVASSAPQHQPLSSCHRRPSLKTAPEAVDLIEGGTPLLQRAFRLPQALPRNGAPPSNPPTTAHRAGSPERGDPIEGRVPSLRRACRLPKALPRNGAPPSNPPTTAHRAGSPERGRPALELAAPTRVEPHHWRSISKSTPEARRSHRGQDALATTRLPAPQGPPKKRNSCLEPAGADRYRVTPSLRARRKLASAWRSPGSNASARSRRAMPCSRSPSCKCAAPKLAW